jgi:hypothetical protein
MNEEPQGRSLYGELLSSLHFFILIIIVSIYPYYKNGNSIQYRLVQLIACAEEENKLWQSRYARIFRSRHISSDSV